MGSVVFRQIGHGAADCKTQKDAVENAPVVHTGMPRDLFGRIGLRTLYS